MPAGRYLVRVEGGGSGGMMMLGIGQDQFALRSESIAWPAPPIEIAFPVDVRALIVRADEDLRRAIRRVIVEPLDIVPARARLTDLVARRAVRYDEASVFFLDDRSFAEPEGFWIGGNRQSAFVVQPDRPQSSIELHLRNAPVVNRVTIASGQWQEALTLAPGEERRVQVPVAPGQTAVLVTAATTAGFRPSESTPGSRDERFLGVWVAASGALQKRGDPSEVEALHLQVAVVIVDLVDDVKRAVAALGAEIVGEVHRAVEVEIEVAAAVALDLGQLEERELAGDRDIGRHIPASNQAHRRNGGPRADEFEVEDVRQAGLDVGVLGLEDEPQESPVAIDEVVFVGEAVGPPDELGLDGDGDRKFDAVEDDVAVEHGFGVVPDRRVLEPELVLRCRPQHDSELREPAPSRCRGPRRRRCRCR